MISRLLLLESAAAASLWTAAYCPAWRFAPPGPEDRAAAIGPVEGLAPELAAALDPSRFEPIPQPRPGDWLDSRAELGETYEEFDRGLPEEGLGGRKRLYLRPLSALPAALPPRLLGEFAEAFFGLPVVVTGPLDGSLLGFSSRRDPSTGRQLKTGDIFRFLKQDLPEDAFAVLAVTNDDLYPIATWRFVFGQASPGERVGVFSTARLASGPGLLRARAFRTLAHEMGHLFGLRHCVFFRCLMNGANRIEEADSQPLRLCPVCLRKLQRVAGFDVAERERRLDSMLGTSRATARK